MDRLHPLNAREKENDGVQRGSSAFILDCMTWEYLTYIHTYMHIYIHNRQKQEK